MLSVIGDEAVRSELAMSLDELAREGARRMLAAALEAEVDAYIACYATLTDERGHRLVRRNGHAPARQVATGTGQIEVVRPRVDDRRVDPATGGRRQFQSVILPRWCRRSPKVAEVLPLLYLHGLSSSDFVPALTELLGSAAGLSASVITRLATQWQAEREAFAQRDLEEVDYVYCFADGVHFSIRLGEQGRLCCLVIVGVRADGRKELVAVADGTRESTDDWAELLRDLRRRGMGAPVVMVGDGALGLWRALREVFPATREQKCWVHKVRNVLGALPKSVHAGARKALNEIIMAEDLEHARAAIETFASDYGVKWPKAVAKVVDDQDALLTFFDYPAEHWVHLRTTNPIESSFSPVRARTRVTKGPGTRDTGLADGVQAAAGRRGPLAGGQRPAPGRAGPGRREIREGQAGRTRPVSPAGGRMTARTGQASSPLRQLATLAAVLEHITASSVLDGAILLGSFAHGTPDPASDLDLIVCVHDGDFATAWRQRIALQVTDAMVWWDQHLIPDRMGTHKWVTNDLVLVECLLAAPDSGVRLAPPYRVVAGAPGLAERFTARPPIQRAELGLDVHPVEHAYDQLKEVIRSHRQQLLQAPADD
jgi:transposase-like protein